jgi:exonuclease V gamma subunit
MTTFKNFSKKEMVLNFTDELSEFWPTVPVTAERLDETSFTLDMSEIGIEQTADTKVSLTATIESTEMDEFPPSEIVFRMDASPIDICATC